MVVARLAILAAVLLPGGIAAGQEQAPAVPGAAAPRRIAVIVMSGGGVSPDTASELTEILIAAVAFGGQREVIGKEELQARLGQDEAGSRQCIESPICLANVGAELSVDEIIAGTVAQREDGFAVNLIRQDIASGEVRGRFVRDVRGDQNALPPVLQIAAAEIYREPERPAEVRVDANVPGAEVFLDDRRVGMTPLRLTDVAPGPHRLRVDALGWRGQTRRLRLASGGHEALRFTLVEAPEERQIVGGTPPNTLAAVTCWTSAGLAVASGALATVFGLRSQGAPDEGVTQVEAARQLDSREDEALVANIAFAGAGAFAVLAVYLLAFQGDAVFGTPEGAEL